MKKFNVQYSTMRQDPVPSTWPEFTKEVKANTTKEAIEKFNLQKNQAGSNPWIVLDCWETEDLIKEEFIRVTSL